MGEPTYAAKIEPEELRLDWTRPAVELHRLVRVGGAFTSFRGRRLKVWRSQHLAADELGELGDPAASSGTRPPGSLVGPVVGTGDGLLGLVEVQPEGKGRMEAGAWLRGLQPPPGADERLGS